MKYSFNSHFSDDILAYIRLRTSLGNKEESFARRLHSFDELCRACYPNEEILTQEIAEAWCTLRPNECTQTLQLRTGILRGFARYLNSIGKNAYIIPNGFVGKPTYSMPYLYTDKELARFFYGADHLQPHPLSPHREYIAPVLFRMLYCCGLRPQEGRLLRCGEVDLDEGMVYISGAKRGKDRIVAMSPDLCELCIKYDTLMRVRLPGREYFFQNPNGGSYSAAWVQKQFFRSWKAAGVVFEESKNPRVYDWRHNFATRIITRWMHEGKSVAPLLPYLSTYMGHTSLEHTAHYIHLVPENLQSSGLTDWHCDQEVPTHED